MLSTRMVHLVGSVVEEGVPHGSVTNPLLFI